MGVGGAAGAGGAPACDERTLSITVTMDPVAATAARLTAQVVLDGGATASTSVAPAAGAVAATIVVDLPAGAAPGSHAAVVVVATRADASPLTSGSASATLVGPCPSVAVYLQVRASYQFGAPPNRKLDMIVVIDTSPGMAVLQSRFVAQFPVFTNILKMLPTADGMGVGLPDLHLAVISSDTGPGRYDLPARNCRFGGDGGRFQYAPRGACAVSPLLAAPTQQTFLAASDNQQQKNYAAT